MVAALFAMALESPASKKQIPRSTEVKARVQRVGFVNGRSAKRPRRTSHATIKQLFAIMASPRQISAYRRRKITVVASASINAGVSVQINALGRQQRGYGARNHGYGQPKVVSAGDRIVSDQ